LKALGRCVRRRIARVQRNSWNTASCHASSDLHSAFGASDND
jgi:hypothetical protein